MQKAKNSRKSGNHLKKKKFMQRFLAFKKMHKSRKYFFKFENLNSGF